MNTGDAGQMPDLQQQFADAARSVFEHAGRQVQLAIEALDRAWPGWREFAEHIRDWTPESAPQNCHCLCGAAHGSFGVCAGEAEPGLMRHGRLDGMPVEIPVCRPCEDAALTRT